MRKYWNVQEEIRKRVNEEAEQTWGQTARPTLPKFEKTKIIRNNVGWYNFCKLVRELKP